jgi:hypothetical protein
MTLVAPFALGTVAYLTYWFVSGKMFHKPAERALAAAVMTSSHIATLQVLLGLFHKLSGGNLVVAHSVALALVWAVTAAIGIPSAGMPRRLSIRGTVHVLGFAAVALCLLGGALLLPPYGWDSLTYHVTHIVNYAKTGALDVMPLPGRNTFYPQVVELHMLWTLLLGGKWALFKLNAALIPFAFLGALGVFNAARHLGFEKGARAASWLYIATPVVLVQSASCYVDAAASGYYMACMAFVLGYLKAPGKGRLAMAALSLGLLLGTKMSFLYFSLPLVLLAAFGTVRGSAFRQGERRALGGMIPIVLLLVYMGPGFALTRNLILTGNPLYPSRVRAAGMTLFEGPREIEHGSAQQGWFVDSTAGWLKYPFNETFSGDLVYTLESGFGPQFGAALLLWPFAACAAVRGRRRAFFWTLMALPLMVFLWFTVHLYREPRYLVQCCGVTALIWAWLCGDESAAVRRAAYGTALVCVFFSLGSTLPRLHPLQGDLIKLESGTRASYLYAHDYGGAARAWDWLSEVTSREGGAVVALNYTELVSPLFGWNLQNTVTHVSVGYGPYEHIDFAEDYQEWRGLLREKNVDYFYAYTPAWAGGVFPEADWARDHPEDFKRVRSFGEEVTVYETAFEDRRLEGVRGYPIPVTLEMNGLNDGRAWRLVYTEGAEASLGQGDDCLALDWEFPSKENNYFEVLSYVGPADWTDFTQLRFRVSDWREGDLLFVYLKTPGEGDFCRYRLSPRAGWSVIEIDLREPDEASDAFTLRNVTTMHLVVDDCPDGTPGAGSTCVGGFRLVSPGHARSTSR